MKADKGHETTLRSEQGNQMTYELWYHEDMECFVAVPTDETADALTLPGDTEYDARAWADEHDIKLVYRKQPSNGRISRVWP